jgi:hypothetical protein
VCQNRFDMQAFLGHFMRPKRRDALAMAIDRENPA